MNWHLWVKNNAGRSVKRKADELLKYITEKDMIDLSYMRRQSEMKKPETLLNGHWITEIGEFKGQRA